MTKNRGDISGRGGVTADFANRDSVDPDRSKEEELEVNNSPLDKLNTKV